MWIFLFFLSTFFFSAQAMEKKKEHWSNYFARTYVRECGRENLKKEGLCPSVSSSGVTISARKKGPTIQLITEVKKITDTSNNPEFGRGGIRGALNDHSFAALRRLINNDKEDETRVECTMRSYPYIEVGSNRMYYADDITCLTYVSFKKLLKFNQSRIESAKEDNSSKRHHGIEPLC